MNVQSSFYRSVNGIERVPRSNLARLPAITSFWTLFVGIHATERKSCTGVLCRPFNHCCTVTPTFATSFDNFIPTYHSLHVCSRQALLCARLAACRVPLVIVLLRQLAKVCGHPTTKQEDLISIFAPHTEHTEMAQSVLGDNQVSDF